MKNYKASFNQLEVSDFQRSSFIKGVISGTVLIVMIFFGLVYTQIYFPQNPPANQPVPITVQKGESIEKIAAKLWERRLIKNPVLWIWYAGLTGRAHRLQAGSYEFGPGTTPAQISRMLAEGKTTATAVKVTVLPGDNLKKLDKRLAETFANIKLGQLLAVDENFSFKRLEQFNWVPPRLENFLKANQVQTLEGLVAADTYFLNQDASLEDFLPKALAQFAEQALPVLQQESLAASKLSSYQILILASLLEKEVPDFQDKRMVAGILLKRLQNQMPLQVDATVNYVTGRNLPAVSLKDTEVDSPYNTYKNKGLPPSPIASVSLESIQAALKPKESPYWFYLSTDGQQTIYSETFKQHIFAKQKYLTP